MKEAYIQSKIENNIGKITFFHPKGNSFPSTQLKALKAEIDKLGQDDLVKVISLESEGDKVFCAGASFDELLQITDEDQGLDFFMGFADVLLSMKNCPKFIVASVHGKAVGGGVGLIAGCDYAIATDDVLLKLSEISIGIGPFVIEPAITRKIGISAFSQLTLSPTEWMDAQWALDKGLLHKVVNDKDKLEAEVNNFAERLSRYSLSAMAKLKNVMYRGTENWEIVMKENAGMSGSLVLSEETKTILSQFKKK